MTKAETAAEIIATWHRLEANAELREMARYSQREVGLLINAITPPMPLGGPDSGTDLPGNLIRGSAMSMPNLARIRSSLQLAYDPHDNVYENLWRQRYHADVTELVEQIERLRQENERLRRIAAVQAHDHPPSEKA